VAPRLLRRPASALLTLALLGSACTFANASAGSTTPTPTPAASTSCAPPAADEGAIPIRDEFGGCPVTRAFYERCSIHLDPVIAVLGPPERRFIGGRFAVAVDAIPQDATSIGVAPGLEGTWRLGLFLEPGTNGRLFVVAGDTVSRWLELPATAPAEMPRAFVLGDSIALGSAPEIVSSLPAWTTTIDAVVGRPSADGVAIAGAISRPRPSAVVVELGTNDRDRGLFARNARAILGSLRREPLVVWVAPRAPSEVTAKIRRTVARLATETSNTVVADWDAYVPASALSSDGVHLLPEHVGLFADFLAPYLRAWRLAVDGAGPAGCLAPPASAA
jgi:hypothetical protein